MKVISPDISEGGNIPERFTCDGQDVNPTLRIEGVPEAAKSLVLIADDPDAPSGTFTHWLMWNLNFDLTEILATTPPAGAVQGVNDFWKKRIRWSVPRGCIAIILGCSRLIRLWSCRRIQSARFSMPSCKVTLSARRR